MKNKPHLAGWDNNLIALLLFYKIQMHFALVMHHVLVIFFSDFVVCCITITAYEYYNAVGGAPAQSFFRAL